MPSNLTMPLILTSTSVTRRHLLTRLNLPFDVISPEVDESPLADEMASDLARRLAAEKASVVASQFPYALVIGSDQVVWREGAPHELIGKPLTNVNACKQLQGHSGKLVHFETAVNFQCHQLNINTTELVRYSVKFRELSRAEINRYVDFDQPFQCAGSFKCESLGISLFESMHGDDFTTLMGLPLIKVCNMLREIGWEIP
jgi:MAF protein